MMSLLRWTNQSEIGAGDQPQDRQSAVSIDRQIAGAVVSHRARLSGRHTELIVVRVDAEIWFRNSVSKSIRLIDGAIAPAIVRVGLRVILPTLSPLPSVNLTGRTQSIQKIVLFGRHHAPDAPALTI